MNKVQSSMFLFWCLLECLLHVCLPYVDELYPFGKAAGLPGSVQLPTPKAPVEKPGGPSSIARENAITVTPTSGSTLKPSESQTSKGTSQNTDTPEPTEISHEFLARSAVPRFNSWNAVIIPRRPGLVHVISVSSIAFAVALICGLIISYMIHRLVKAEEKQQLATLYENVEIPLLDEKEVSEGDVQAETDEPHPENEELGKFIGSVIRTKRREHILKKKMKGEQNLPTENPLESSNYADQVESHDNVESHDSMEKDEEEENL
ncbi:uncharacterized protein C19orf18 homolog [Peromyscus maniculatus bairdii]|uniref:uncharacterized protein C19orf18 homolog n=1 Tax=Peromyscus maniculatus bairdii TaxID=230844 RepID=UPI00077DAFC5|nr:uncharacterized protein C19orf18 homolog isoform X1 [Peromyscus maniculatus bairdii]